MSISCSIAVSILFALAVCVCTGMNSPKCECSTPTIYLVAGVQNTQTSHSRTAGLQNATINTVEV